MKNVSSLSVTSVGIQAISGRTGTPLQPFQLPQESTGENKREREREDQTADIQADAHADVEAEPVLQSAAAPGTGRLIDKTI